MLQYNFIDQNRQWPSLACRPYTPSILLLIECECQRDRKLLCFVHYGFLVARIVPSPKYTFNKYMLSKQTNRTSLEQRAMLLFTSSRDNSMTFKKNDAKVMSSISIWLVSHHEKWSHNHCVPVTSNNNLRQRMPLVVTGSR